MRSINGVIISFLRKRANHDLRFGSSQKSGAYQLFVFQSSLNISSLGIIKIEQIGRRPCACDVFSHDVCSKIFQRRIQLKKNVATSSPCGDGF